MVGDRTNIFRRSEIFSQTSTGQLSLDKRLSVDESDQLTRKSTGITYMCSHIRRLDLPLLMGTGNVNRVYAHKLVVVSLGAFPVSSVVLNVPPVRQYDLIADLLDTNMLKLYSDLLRREKLCM